MTLLFRGMVSVALVAFVLTVAPFVAAQTEDEDEDPVAIFNAGQELHEKGDLAEAIKLYEKALSLVSEFPEAEYQRGAALLNQGKTDDAERAFRRVLQLRPEWTLAMTSLGSMLVRRQPAEAELLLEKVVKTEPQNSLALAALTELRLNTNSDPAVLRDLLSKVTALTTGKANPTASIWAARAALESALGMRTEVRSSVARGLAIDARNRSLLARAAEAALADGDLLRARELTEQLKAAGGEAGTVSYLSAAVLALEGKTADAQKLLAEIAAPSAAAIELRDRLKAANATPAELEKLLDADPKNAALLGRLCGEYRRDDPAKALDYCRRANAAEPENITHAVGYGAALVQAKQFEPAVALLKRILTIAPGHGTARANLAAALFQLKRYAEAKAEFRWLTDNQPKEAVPYYFLAIAHDQLGEYVDALANYQQYLRLADADRDKLEIEKVNLRLPQVERLVKQGKGKR